MANLSKSHSGSNTIKSLIPSIKKGKETTMAIKYIRRISNLTGTNNWSETAAYSKFANSPQGQAREWPSSFVEIFNCKLGTSHGKDSNCYSRRSLPINAIT